ncbi:hypothetical protein LTR37_009301 [Vermiconidia calcicola]|uniref:Uncharacterized protein n=1 Tax=Vermiconidia calcicola TaxID=1690605 RepID=A0ACC3N855_9PEZI|nr:hypothetical protein LTR37_009301 [Vermiconidia calcicola]
MDSSPFSKLAPELRNAIYDMVNDNAERVTILVKGNQSPTPLHLLSLAQTCTKMREECMSIFYSTNTFELQTRTFNIDQLQKEEEVHLHEDAAKAIAQTRSREWKKLRNGTELPATWKWLRQIGEGNACRIREIEIDLGAWRPSHPQHVAPAFALSNILAPIASFFKQTGAECTIVLCLVDEEFEIDDLCLPLADLKAASRRLNDMYHTWIDRLGEAEASGQYSTADAERVHQRIDQGWMVVERLLHRTRLAMEDRVDLFA